jgi:hypothetical protein
VGIEFRCNHQLRYIGLAKMQMGWKWTAFDQTQFPKRPATAAPDLMTYALFILSKMGQSLKSMNISVFQSSFQIPAGMEGLSWQNGSTIRHVWQKGVQSA